MLLRRDFVHVRSVKRDVPGVRGASRGKLRRDECGVYGVCGVCDAWSMSTDVSARFFAGIWNELSRRQRPRPRNTGDESQRGESIVRGTVSHTFLEEKSDVRVCTAFR